MLFIFTTVSSRSFYDNSRLSSSEDTKRQIFFPVFARGELSSVRRTRGHTGAIYRTQRARGKGGSSVQFRIRIVGR